MYVIKVMIEKIELLLEQRARNSEFQG